MNVASLVAQSVANCVKRASIIHFPIPAANPSHSCFQSVPQFSGWASFFTSRQLDPFTPALSGLRISLKPDYREGDPCSKLLSPNLEVSVESRPFDAGGQFRSFKKKIKPKPDPNFFEALAPDGEGDPPIDQDVPYKHSENTFVSMFSGYPPIEEQKLIQVGLLGIPNAGKSELTNKLIGNKITAVSRKENTTVAPHLGAFVDGETQVILYDLPGVLKPAEARFAGQTGRIETAWATTSHCDVVLFIVDVSKQLQEVDTRVLDITQQLHKEFPVEDGKEEGRHVCLLLNKVDLVKSRSRLKDVANQLFEIYNFRKCFFTSALKGGGIRDLKHYLVKEAHRKEWLLPPGYITDKNPVDLALELVREKIFRRLNKELPYQLNPIHEEWIERPDGTATAKQVLFVRSENMRRIVVGRKGNIIQDYIAANAEKELHQILGREVNVCVDVRVQPFLGKSEIPRPRRSRR